MYTKHDLLLALSLKNARDLEKNYWHIGSKGIEIEGKKKRNEKRQNEVLTGQEIRNYHKGSRAEIEKHKQHF